MTRLLTTGYETGDIAELGVSAINSNATLTVVSSTPTPRSPGTYCLKSACTGSALGGSWKSFALAASKTDIWVRFGVYMHPAISNEYVFATVLDSAGTAQTCLGFDAATNNLYLRLTGTYTGTLLATGSTTMGPDGWHTIEWRTQITSTTVGVSEVWLDGARVINFSGDNTATANANVQTVRLGLIAASAAGNTGAYTGYDDIGVNDTSGTLNNGQIYDGRVVLLKPTGAGSTTAQTRGGTDSGANWSQVDELPPSMTDYVYSATAATRDTYALQDVPAGSWSVNCVEALAYAQNSDALAGSLGLTVKSGGTTNEATAQALTATAAYFRQFYETDPNTSSAWAVAAVDALEAGTTVR